MKVILLLLLASLDALAVHCSRRHMKTSSGLATIKVVTVGMQNAGKTSLLCRLNSPSDKLGQRVPTIVAAMATVERTVNDKKHTLHVWDTAGQEKTNAMTSNLYIRGAAIILIVFDTTTKVRDDRLTRLSPLL